MTLHQVHLVAFAAGAVIHGVQTVLIWKLWRQTSGANRQDAREGVFICFPAFLWQAGNFWRELALTYDYREGAAVYEIGNGCRALALLVFPVVFSYMIDEPRNDSVVARFLARFARGLRYPLMVFAAVAALSIVFMYLGKRPPLDANWAEAVTLNIMLFYFIVFMVLGVIKARSGAGSESLPALRANRAGIIASILAVATFFMMLWSPGRVGGTNWLQLAAMMTSVPFTVAAAYRLYQFPFMDAFLREVLSGVALLAAFLVALSAAPSSADVLPLWLAAAALGLAFAKAPLSRWVDRNLLGYSETAEEQEERIGNAIRGLSQLPEFGTRVVEILRQEMEADWVSVSAEPRADAVTQFQIAGSSPMWLSLGPRKGARTYMSRQLRVVRRALLELAAQQERLQREDTERRQLVQHHELREITAKAQMRALQAQINPHFLFNTLNVLANLIHSNPARAEHVTEDLAEIFRYALESTRRDWVHLEDELRFLESYLEIEKARFESRLTYTFDVDAPARLLRIPPMILQPLVENAIRHGIGPEIEGGQVRVIARTEVENLVIYIEDTGAGLAHKGRGGTGIGLPNVRERLAHVYGGAAVLRLEELPGAGTRVVLLLPRHIEVQA